MTTTLDRPPDIDAAAHDEDPFRYGWRYVRRERPDGYVVFDEIPLTLEDLLHPEEGDHVTHSDAHQHHCLYLYNVFLARVRADPSAVVLNDVRIKWDNPELRPHGPDLMVIFGVRERKNWSTFDVESEGVRPALIVEITSPDTEDIDRSKKLEHYDLAGVPLYIIVDTVRRRGQSFLRLLGYHQAGLAYEVLPPDEHGRLWIEPLRLWMGVHENELFCYDEQGVQIGNYTDVTAALAAEREARSQAEAQAKAEREARDQAEARAKAEREARDQAEARAKAEREARDQAEARAVAAEARLRELEAELRSKSGM
jgi:Uma2 family endonuclease